jgi:hypothetical protein
MGYARAGFNVKRVVLGTAVIFLLVSLYGLAGAAGHKSVSPEAPTALKLVIVPNGFKLTWKFPPQDPGAVTGYEIVRSDLASGPFTTVARLDKGVSQYIDTTASSERIYYYKIRAMAGSDFSPYSNTVTGER